MKALVLYLILGKEKIQGYDKFLLTFFSKVTWSQVFSLSKRDCKSPSVCRCVHLLNASAYGKNFVGGAEHNLPEWNLLVTDAQDDSFVTSSFLRHAVIANLPLSVGVCICWMHRRTGKILLGGLNIICPNETCWSQMHKMILSWRQVFFAMPWEHGRSK